MSIPTRGIRNNNPGNIRKNSDPWQGLAETQPDPDFFTFTTPAYGIRALARLLIGYQDRYGLNTVEGIVSRWAPPVENDTGAYVRAVAVQVGVSPTAQINVHDFTTLKALVEAIITHENGYQPYTDAQLSKGLVLAGVEPPSSSLNKSRTITGARIATLGTAASAAASFVQASMPSPDAVTSALNTVNTVQAQSQTLMAYAPWAKWLFIAATLAGIFLTVWARMDDRRQGLR